MRFLITRGHHHALEFVPLYYSRSASPSSGLSLSCIYTLSLRFRRLEAVTSPLARFLRPELVGAESIALRTRVVPPLISGRAMLPPTLLHIDASLLEKDINDDFHHRCT